MSVNIRQEEFFGPCCVLYHVTECEIISTVMSTCSSWCHYWTCAMPGGVQSQFEALIPQV